MCFSHLEVAQLTAVGGEIEGLWGSVQAVQAALHSNGTTHCHLLVDQLQETHFPVKTCLTLHRVSLTQRTAMHTLSTYRVSVPFCGERGQQFRARLRWM